MKFADSTGSDYGSGSGGGVVVVMVNNSVGYSVSSLVVVW